METKVKAVTTVSAVIKRKDGTIEDLGVVASTDKGNVVTKTDEGGKE